VGNRTGVLGSDRGELGGFGGHISKNRPGRLAGLIDHLLELAEPVLAHLAGSLHLLAARTTAAYRLPGCWLFALPWLVVRAHFNTSN
jgi:hypothetical protein